MSYASRAANFLAERESRRSSREKSEESTIKGEGLPVAENGTDTPQREKSEQTPRRFRPTIVPATPKLDLPSADPDAVAERVAAMRRQLPRDPLQPPALVRVYLDDRMYGCGSCDAPIGEHDIQCAACIVAAHTLDAELKAARWVVDPRRADLHEDSALWARLLPLAFERDGRQPSGLFGALHGLRRSGARLAIDAGGHVRLERGELGDEYPGIREQYLMPHASALIELLAAIAAAV